MLLNFLHWTRHWNNLHYCIKSICSLFVHCSTQNNNILEGTNVICMNNGRETEQKRPKGRESESEKMNGC